MHHVYDYFSMFIRTYFIVCPKYCSCARDAMDGWVPTIRVWTRGGVSESGKREPVHNGSKEDVLDTEDALVVSFLSLDAAMREEEETTCRV
jgi:hypothetical protein